MPFVRVAGTEELPSGKMKAFDVAGKKILLANADGAFYAMDNKCTHIGKPLDQGSLNGCVVTCKYHNAQFDLRDGENVKDAKLLFLKMSCKEATTYAVKVEGGQIFIDQPQAS